MEGYLNAAIPPQGLGRCKVVIVPHAGYKYSGRTAAFSYKMLHRTQPNLKHLIVIGPSHRQYMRNSILASPFSSVETPFGELPVEPIEGIPLASESVDQNEHSIEMQYPFLAYAFPHAKISPVLVGQCSDEVYSKYAGILAKELQKESTVCIVSSDFCHWGRNYNYCPNLLEHYEGDTLSACIQAMDKKGIDSVFSNDVRKLRDYLQITDNTICGSGPLMLSMKIIETLDTHGQWHLLRYEQSNQIQRYDPNQASVSYVSAAYCI